MKKIVFCLMATFLSLTFLPLQSNAATTDASAASSSLVVPKSAGYEEFAESAEAKVLLLRLNEINAMDKSNLTSSDKKNLRNEVLSIRKNLKSIGGGVYISGAALLIIIIVLLIVLL